MFCNNCGNRLEAGNLFCNACGARVAPEAPVQPPVYQQPDSEATVGVGFTPRPAAPQPQYQPPVQQPTYQPDYEATVGVGFAPQPPMQQAPVQQPPVQQPQWSYQPQQPQYYQPPVQQQYQPPQYQPPVQQPWSYVPEQPKKEKKPINKRKLFATIAAGLLILALVGGVFAYFTIFNTPEYQVYTAAQKTIEELETVLGKGKPVVTAVKNLVEMSKNGEMSMNISVDGQSITYDYSRDDEILYAEANLMGTEIVIAADDETLALSLPGVLDNAYSIPLKDFGEKLCDWDLIASEIPSDVRKQLEDLSIDLFSDTSWEEFKDTDAYERFEEKLVYEETEASIPNADCSTVYRIEADVEDVMELLLDYMEFAIKPILGEELGAQVFGASMSVLKQEMREEVRGITIVLLVGINDNDCIVAVRGALLENGVEEGSIAIVLAGENNPWEVIEAYENDTLVGSLRILTTDSGFELYADDYRVLCGDGEYLTFDPDGYDPVKLRYGASGGGCDFGLDVEGMPVEISMKPNVSAKKISGKVVDIFSMDMADLEALAEEIENLEYLFD